MSLPLPGLPAAAAVSGRGRAAAFGPHRDTRRRLHRGARLAGVAALLASALSAAVVPRVSPAQPATAAPPAAFTLPVPPTDPAAARAMRLPPEVEAALESARIPSSALVLWVQELGRPVGPRVAWQVDQPVNPASLMKLLPTFAALDLLGPSFAWRTPVWLGGPVRDGVLDGPLVLRGSGDPRLVIERLWLALRRVQQLGVREIRGDIVLDRSAFTGVEGSPAAFDGEPHRPYNVQPDALLLNQRSVVLTFLPDPSSRVARVAMEPALAGVTVPPTVPLAAGPCGDWRGQLRADFGDPARVTLAGAYPAACGERTWPVAPADPAGFNARLLEGLWRDLGGTLRGRVRDGTAPGPQVPPAFEITSPPLAEVVRDINKFSNNVMAQQLFLTLALQPRPTPPPPGGDTGGVPAVPSGGASPAAAREVLAQWAQSRLGEAATGLVIDNGSGLSREQRLSARLLGRLLQLAWVSPVMPEFIASLPVSGADGTVRRMRGTDGRAHLKTGSLRDVAGIAGYVHAPSGRRFAVVAIVNHPAAGAARPAFEALVQSLVVEAAP
jgi:D-alanyl-D-alanine carboxypeptidase/D-alanyl-D-alanine-endopeptidase (penicillin-binding protein 4)